MAINTNWTPLVPDGADSPADGDNAIRDLKTAIGQRMRHGGQEWEPSAGSSLQAGRHKCLDTGDTDVIDATMLAGEFYLWDAAGTGKLVTLADSTAATPSRLTIASSITLHANGGITTTGTLTPTTLTVVGNATVGGTLGVTGATTLKATTIGTGGGTLTCNDVATMAGGLVSSGATTMSGNILRGATAVSGTYSVQTGDNTLFVASGGGYVITLPSAVTQANRTISFVIVSGSGVITIKSAAGNIDNQPAATGISFRLAAGGNVSAGIFQSNGTDWFLLSTRYLA